MSDHSTRPGSRRASWPVPVDPDAIVRRFERQRRRRHWILATTASVAVVSWFGFMGVLMNPFRRASPDPEAANRPLNAIESMATAAVDVRTSRATAHPPPRSPEAREISPSRKASKLLPRKESKAATLSNFLQTAERLRGEGLIGDAIQTLERAAARYPSSPEPRAEMGWCYYALEQPVAALRQFTRALEVDRHHGAAQFGSAQALHALGRDTEAAAFYERYLEESPDGDYAAAARRQLAKRGSSEGES